LGIWLEFGGIGEVLSRFGVFRWGDLGMLVPGGFWGWSQAQNPGPVWEIKTQPAGIANRRGCGCL